MKNVVLFGAGGHSRSVIAVLARNQIQIKCIYDSSVQKSEVILGIPVVGDFVQVNPEEKVVLAIGDNQVRSDLFNRYQPQIFAENIFHPTALLEAHIKWGSSNLVFANTFINNAAEVGDNNLINTSAILEHEVLIGSHNHISVGAILLGRSKIGNHCFVGAGSIIREKVQICDNVTIGAHSYVSENILQPGVYVGSPARKIK